MNIQHRFHPMLVLAAALLLSGCAPRIIGSDGNGEATSGETTEDPSTTIDTLTTDDPTTTTTTTTTTDATTDMTTFVPEGDQPMGDPCDPFAQDCPEGEKCVPYASSGGSWDAHKCVPIMGAQATGEPCWYGGPEDATDNCDASGMCWDVDAQGDGTCTAFCTGTPDYPTCPPMSSCSLSGDGTLTLCITTCDPLLQDCNEGLACYWANNDFSCIFTTQDIPTGQPCGFINDCAEGNICVDGLALPDCMGAACCTSFCELGAGPGPCEDVLPGTQCVPFFEEPEPGYEHIGVCILP